MITPASLKLRDDSDDVQDITICVSPNPIWPSDAKAFKIGATDEGRVACRIAVYFLVCTTNPFSGLFFVTHRHIHRQSPEKVFSKSCCLGTVNCGAGELKFIDLLAAAKAGLK